MKHRAWARLRHDADFHGYISGSRSFPAVTLVANHDTQPLQALEAPVNRGLNRWRML